MQMRCHEKQRNFPPFHFHGIGPQTIWGQGRYAFKTPSPNQVRVELFGIGREKKEDEKDTPTDTSPLGGVRLGHGTLDSEPKLSVSTGLHSETIQDFHPRTYGYWSNNEILSSRPITEEEEKYESVLNIIRRLCNKEHASLNCTSYQSLRKDIIRLDALSFYLQEKKCFPEGVGINSTLDLLLQCFSTEVTCESGAALAATLANGGLCPLSGDQVLSPTAVRCTLSMMQVAGMNDYSRAFHFRTSVPAKSSQSGVVLIVIPGVLGLMCWSPGLDSYRNSCRGVHFCEELVSTFQLHSFDIKTSFRQMLSYRQWKVESEGYQIMNVLLAAYRGDVVSLRRYLLSGADANAVDYDGRSALHVAASEGHLDIIKFLVENAGANCTLKDRWGNTALQEAVRCNQDPAIQLLRKYTDNEESL